jgi:hypothetical protein
MALFENCVERATALAATCGWLAFGGGAEAAVGVAIGAAGLSAVVSDAVRKHGPESQVALRRIRKNIAADLRQQARIEKWELDPSLINADAAMERALVGCFLDRKALAASAMSPKGFPGAATELILQKLADREPQVFGAAGDEAAVRYAEIVIRTALEASVSNERYFRELHPSLLLELLKGVGTLELQVSQANSSLRRLESHPVSIAVHRTYNELMQMPVRLQERVDAGEQSVEFAEARSALIQLYATAKAVGDGESARKVEQFQSIYNGYIEILRAGSAKRVTIEQVNQYHSVTLLGSFRTLFGMEQDVAN